MAKDFNGISGEPLAIVTNKVTCAIKPVLKVPDMRKFAQVIDLSGSYCQITVNDYQKNQFTKYNLEIGEIRLLANAAKQCHLPRQFFGQKIWGAYPEKSGEFVGMCKCFHIQISRSDKTRDGQVQRNPWNISIQNGYGISQKVNEKGAVVEKTGSFKQTAAASIYMTDKDFNNLCEQYLRYEEMWMSLPFVREAYAKGYQALLEAENQRDSTRQYVDRHQQVNQPVQAPQEQQVTYQKGYQYQQQEMSAYNQQLMPPQQAVQQAPRQMQPQMIQQAPSQMVQQAPQQGASQYKQGAAPQQMPTQTNQQQLVQGNMENTIFDGETYRKTVVSKMRIVGELIVPDDGSEPVAECEIKGKRYNVAFDCFPNELDDAYNRGIWISGVFYMKHGTVHFYNLSKSA